MNDLEQPGDTEPRPPNPWAKPGCVTLRCREDGPLVIELPGPEAGPVQAVRVIDHAGGEFALPAGKRAVALCRCGKSAHKPFCDGSHRAAGFQSGELAGDGS